MTRPSLPPPLRFDRRALLQGMGLGAIGLTASAGYMQALAQGFEPLPTTGVGAFFTTDEMAFVTAAADRLILPSDAGPGAIEAEAHLYIDRALDASYGVGHRLYLEGPFAEGTPEQGYQLPLTPAELYRLAIEEIDAHVAAAQDGTVFAGLPPAEMDRFLAGLQSGDVALATIPGPLFFATLWFDVRMGYFGDPIHGGNRDMAAWRMLGFPGAMTDLRQYLGVRSPVEIEPVSLAMLFEETSR